MLGRFLEISLHTPDVQASLAFYELLGFVQAPVNEGWRHQYAVVTDGHLFLGLHGVELPSPTLTFVLPDLLHGVDALRSLGVEFEQEHLGNDVFNYASFRDPNRQRVLIVEARTFSPPALEGQIATTCGYFSELGLPTRDLDATRAFWEPLGFVALEEELRPFPRTALTSDRVNLGLYRTRAFREPLLTFEDTDMRERLARLRERGCTLSDEMPDILDESSNAVVIAPEGTRLLLMDAAI